MIGIDRFCKWTIEIFVVFHSINFLFFSFFYVKKMIWVNDKWGIFSDSHHTPHTVYAIDFLIRLSINDDWLELIDSVNEQSRYLLFFMWFLFYFFICLFFIICLFICLFFLSQKFSTEKNVMSEWKWSICSDSHHTPHTVYAIDFLIRLSMNDYWLELFDSVNE